MPKTEKAQATETKQEHDARKEAEHAEDMADVEIVMSWNGDNDDEQITYTAVGRKSRRHIWAARASACRRSVRSYEDNYIEGVTQWLPWQISVSSTQRGLAESKLFVQLQELVVKFCELHQ